MKVHTLSYGAGAWVVGGICQCAAQEAWLPNSTEKVNSEEVTQSLQSVNLVTPTVDKDWFLNGLSPIKKQFEKNNINQKITLYTLSEADEKRDSFGAYTHTWSSLVEKALFKNKPCIALYKNAKLLYKNNEVNHFYPNNDQEKSIFMVNTYEALRNDRKLFNDIINERILEESNL